MHCNNAKLKHKILQLEIINLYNWSLLHGCYSKTTFLNKTTFFSLIVNDMDTILFYGKIAVSIINLLMVSLNPL